MQKISFIIVFLGLSFLVTGCLPTIFTGATASVVELAKDRPVGETLTDIRIASGIKASFIKNNFRELYTKIKILKWYKFIKKKNLKDLKYIKREKYNNL